MLNQKVQIIPKPESISWEQITDLLHLAYSERANEGLEYVANGQTVEDTIRRVGGGVCLVAFIDARLVGTESYNIIDAKEIMKKKWYHSGKCCFLHSLAVHPSYKRKGIGMKLRSKIIDIAYLEGVDAIYSDTSVKAKWLISWYNRMKHYKVGYTSHSKTNYYSVIMRTTIHGKNFNSIYRLTRYYLSMMKCISVKNSKGEFRFFFRFLRRLFR